MSQGKLKLDPMDQILLKRSLNQNGQAQQFFSSEVARISDPYVPFRQGSLKNTRRVFRNRVEYIQPYAKRQWYGNAGRGTEGTQHGGLRGKFWVHRAMADRGHEVVQSVAKFVGGKAK